MRYINLPYAFPSLFLHPDIERYMFSPFLTEILCADSGRKPQRLSRSEYRMVFSEYVMEEFSDLMKSDPQLEIMACTRLVGVKEGTKFTVPTFGGFAILEGMELEDDAEFVTMQQNKKFKVFQA